eukprot:gb/GECH01014116.1/.p1 GENE.gb/GECH01014116.1/~~gb/GECH01014116.1/.p1  ORF type:complete len:182 (+),score=42.99 gb/GECH01014116.1/:1-546(+)
MPPTSTKSFRPPLVPPKHSKRSPMSQNFNEMRSSVYHRNTQRFMLGTVINTSANKTVNVLMHRWRFVPKYEKIFRQKKKLLAHDELNECNIGDLVLLKDSRPYSKRKRHMVEAIVEQSPEAVAFKHDNERRSPQEKAELERKKIAAMELANSRKMNAHISKEEAEQKYGDSIKSRKQREAQ